MPDMKVTLACGHTVGVDPRNRIAVGTGEFSDPDRIACRFDGWQNAVKVHTHEWRVRCGKCRYGRWCGQSQQDARALALKHLTANPQHHCTVVFDRVTSNGKGGIINNGR